MIDPKDSPWYAGAAAAIFWLVWWLRKMFRQDKEESSASGLTVTLTSASQSVITMLERRINELVIEVHKLRDQVSKLLQQNHECDQQNMKLTSQIKDLNKRVTVVEKEVK